MEMGSNLTLSSSREKIKLNIRQTICGAMKKFYNKPGRILIPGVTLPKDLEKYGFSKYDCDYAVQFCEGDIEKASDYLFMKYKLVETMNSALLSFNSFESFFIWENDRKSGMEIATIDNDDDHELPFCLVCSKEELEKKTTNVLTAQKNDIPIVSEYFIWDNDYFPEKGFPSPQDYPVVDVKLLFDTEIDNSPFLFPDEFLLSEPLKKLFLANNDLNSIQSSSPTLRDTSMLFSDPNTMCLALIQEGEEEEGKKLTENILSR
jgi:hypothetical protein